MASDYISLLSSLLTEFKDTLDLLDGSVVREFSFPEMANKIKVAIGVRRSGKTYLCLQKIRQYLESGDSLLKDSIS